MKYAALLGCIMLCKNLTAKVARPFNVGEYYVHGVMEVGSGFSFKADNTFEFFFVEFQNVVLKFKDGQLTGLHPLLEEKNYTYVKEGN